MEKVKYLEKMAAVIRRDIVEMIGVGHAGHVGGSLSCADIMACLYFYKMNIKPGNFSSKDRDRFIMSKGHSVLAQYAALAELGFFDKSELSKTKSLGSFLQGHPDRNKTPGIEANTGSLGQGLSIGCGVAWASSLDGIKNTVYVLLGDSELAEGQVWEAAMAASNFGLSNLIAIVDYNGMGSVGFNCDRFNIKDIKEKFISFGWHAFEIDGHDIGSITGALDECDGIKDKPKVIIASTTKGKGLPFAERNPGFHNAALSAEQYGQAIDIFDKRIEEVSE